MVCAARVAVTKGTGAIVTEGALPVCARAAAVKRTCADNETRKAGRTRIPCFPCSEIERLATNWFLVLNSWFGPNKPTLNQHLKTNSCLFLLSLLRLRVLG